MSEYLSKKAVLEWLDDRRYKSPWIESFRDRLESGAFDADDDLAKENERLKIALFTHESYDRTVDDMHDEIQRLRAALASLPDKIMDMKWTDTEELTFPLDNPTAEEQSEWLDEFIDRLDMHVRNIIDNEIEALSTTTEPCVCESIKCECGHHEPTGAERVKPTRGMGGKDMICERHGRLRCGDCAYVEELKEEVESLQQQVKTLQKEQGWISVKDRLPENRKRVLVRIAHGNQKYWITCAEYIAPKSILAEDFINEDSYFDEFYDYDAESDTYWAPSGFYESNYYTDENYFIRDVVTHWQPLPEPPKEE